MKAIVELEFVRAWWQPRGIAAVLMISVLVMTGLLVESAVELTDIRQDLENVEHRIEQRKRANEANQLRQRRLSPEDRRIERALREQSMSMSDSGFPVVDWIEQAWTPDIAIRQIAVDKAGSQARIEGGALTLAQIYGFADRLRGDHPDRRIGLLRHNTAMEQGGKVIYFSLSIEQP